MKLTSLCGKFLSKLVLQVAIQKLRFPTHRCYIFLLFILGLLKLTLTYKALFGRWILSKAAGEMAHKYLYISLARLTYNQFIVMNITTEWRCGLYFHAIWGNMYTDF